MTPRLFAPSILSGVLLWLAFFPVNAGPVALVALVPFLSLVRAEGVTRRRRYLAAFAGGVTFFGLAFNWVRVAHPMMATFAWPGVTLYCAAYWPLALLLLRRLDRAAFLPGLTELPRDGGRARPPFALTLPIAWVVLEYVRAHFPTGFPFLAKVGAYQHVGVGWYALGYSQHDIFPLIQAADLGGVYLVSAVVASVNGAAYEWAARLRPFRWLCRMPRGWAPPTFTREFTATATAVAVVAPTVIYGGYRTLHPPFTLGPEVALLQGSLAQDEKNIRGDHPGRDENEPPPLQKEYFPLADAASRGDGRRPDLIVWPETSFPENWVEVAGDPSAVPAQRRRFAADIADGFAKITRDRWRTNVLYGLNTIELVGEGNRKYNSALLVRADGKVGGRYDKVHLVPFGEYVPLRDWFPWLQKLTPYDHDYSCTPGAGFPRLEVRARDGTTYRVGVLICYEDGDGDLARLYNPLAGLGPGADFLVNISNDGWFDGTEEHEQHLAICRFRAVEARRTVVRAVNMGISGVIDPDGRVIRVAAENSWRGSKKVRAVVREFVPLDNRDSPYALVGDWLPALCAGVCGAALAWRKRATAG